MKTLHSANSRPSTRWTKQMETNECVVELLSNAAPRLIGPTENPVLVIPAKATTLSLVSAERSMQALSIKPFAMLGLPPGTERLSIPDETDAVLIELIKKTPKLTAMQHGYVVCNHQDVFGTVQLLRRHMMTSEVACPVYVNACAAILAFQAENSTDEPARKPRRGRFSNAQWTRLRDYIDTHIDETIRIADLAAVINYSTSQCSKAFKATLGYPPQQYIRERRLSKARECLIQSDAPLADIALATGFCSQAHMTTTFSRILGITPGAVRQSVDQTRAVITAAL